MELQWKTLTFQPAQQQIQVLFANDMYEHAFLLGGSNTLINKLLNYRTKSILFLVSF